MIKRRNIWMQALLIIITLGIYLVYWYYVTAKEMLGSQGQEGSPGLWTFLLLIPIANLVSFWKYAGLVDQVTKNRYPQWLIFVIWLFVSPLVWLITQIELNKLAPDEM